MGKEDKFGNEAFRWARVKVFSCNNGIASDVVKVEGEDPATPGPLS